MAFELVALTVIFVWSLTLSLVLLTNVVSGSFIDALV